MCLFAVEGLDTAISVADLIMPVSICMQSRNQALLVEAALSLMAFRAARGILHALETPQPLPFVSLQLLEKEMGFASCPPGQMPAWMH